MTKIAFIGAGSFGFTRKLVKDVLTFPLLEGAEIALMDINTERLDYIKRACERIVAEGGYPATVSATTDRAEALKDADAVICTILAGGVDIWKYDITIPKKYGVDINVGDTRGPAGVFRALRTIPVMLDYCRVMEQVAPEVLLINYANPMAMLTGAILKGTSVRTVGLCHSVQACASHLCHMLDLPTDDLVWQVAGINHQGWLLSVSRHGEDLYPEIKRRAELPENRPKDTVRFELMKRFSYYVTESSEHSSEYTPWFIKSRAPELIEQFNIPLDEYPRRCVEQIEGWKRMREELLSDTSINHVRGHEYASYILEAIETNKPFTFGGNVLNKGLITNLPADCCVEVMCVADGNGVIPTFVGDLPPQCAALNRTNVNVQELTIEAALTGKREHVYQAALLDPHTAAELTIDETVALCDDLFEAHRDWLPEYH